MWLQLAFSLWAVLLASQLVDAQLVTLVRTINNCTFTPPPTTYSTFTSYLFPSGSTSTVYWSPSSTSGASSSTRSSGTTTSTRSGTSSVSTGVSSSSISNTTSASPSPSASLPVPDPIPDTSVNAGDPFIIALPPLTFSPGIKHKRQNPSTQQQTYITPSGYTNLNASLAAIFRITSSGGLTSSGLLLSTDLTEERMVFAGSVVQRVVSARWGSEGGVLGWRNESFENGEAALLRNGEGNGQGEGALVLLRFRGPVPSGFVETEPEVRKPVPGVVFEFKFEGGVGVGVFVGVFVCRCYDQSYSRLERSFFHKK
ncbi:hypothetical protein K402DRAFT_423125 [Aulographum hederae CBS 113979]|uniref:DUF7908 domain-containing protein n=1 Tax=Aulographum hederae CBS 113979 TaxID=1176131 RepID=A0A6G1GTB2_9PEZI|nr:hypothetical protein K402DRAFT_423125 [Aulographum hederae CBS 113979]